MVIAPNAAPIKKLITVADSIFSPSFWWGLGLQWPVLRYSGFLDIAIQLNVGHWFHPILSPGRRLPLRISLRIHRIRRAHLCYRTFRRWARECRLVFNDASTSSLWLTKAISRNRTVSLRYRALDQRSGVEPALFCCGNCRIEDCTCRRV